MSPLSSVGLAIANYIINGAELGSIKLELG